MNFVDEMLSYFPDGLHPLQFDFQKIDEITFGVVVVTSIIVLGTTFAFRKIICRQASLLIALSFVVATYGLLLTRYVRKFTSIVDIPSETDLLDITIGVLQNIKPVKLEAFQIISDLILITCIFTILFVFFYSRLPFTVMCNIDRHYCPVIMKICFFIMMTTCIFQLQYQGPDTIGNNLVTNSKAGYSVVTNFIECDREEKQAKLHNFLKDLESVVGIKDIDLNTWKSWKDNEDFTNNVNDDMDKSDITQ